MAQVLRRLPHPAADDLILGTGDDAAVWRLDDDRALVATVDVITPIVDDARTWGRIAATNAASDVYAMGGRPLFGLNVVGWSATQLPTELLVEALQGVAQAAADGGWLVVGGHTVDDPEPKLGVAVIGEVAPDALLTKQGLRPGDVLILTKPLGVGVIVTALKAGAVDAPILDAATASMLRSNAVAARVALDAGASAATDVTGFGLLGHLRSLLDASQVAVTLDVAAIPMLAGAANLVAAGHVPGGTGRNLDWCAPLLDEAGSDPALLALLADPQTSGGLLFGVHASAVDEALAALRETGHEAAAIGQVSPGAPRIVLR